MLHAHTILHPTDLTHPSHDAYRTACAIARETQARLVILHVAPEPVSTYLKNQSSFQSGTANEKLWEVIQGPREQEANLGVEHRVEEGDPASEVIKAANETGCDLIVVGTHERHGLDRLLNGSVSEKLVRDAPCSVLVAKARKLNGQSSNA